MGSHKGWDRHFMTINGLAMKNGRSLNLAKGQFAVVDMESVPTSRGSEVISNFTALPMKRKLVMRLGVANLNGARSMSNKSESTPEFKIEEVVGLRVDAPEKPGLTVDKFRVGYDGLRPSTAPQFVNGDNEQISVNLSGEAIGLLGYRNSNVTVKLYLEAPNEGEFTMQEIFEKAAEQFNKKTLIGGVPITNYAKATTINSENVALTGADYSFFKLRLKDDNNESALGIVQAQYPNFKVEKDQNLGDFSTYTILAPTATVLPAFVTSVDSVLPECDECPTGYTLVDGLCTQAAGTPVSWGVEDTCKVSTETYTITLADDECGENRLAELQAYYPELTITVATRDEDAPAVGACMTTYQTTVNTNVVCEECSPEMNAQFVSEAPMSFDQIHWEKEEKVYSENALMGLEITAKATVMYGDENYRDSIPTIMSSVKLNVSSGGEITSESFREGQAGRMNVKLISRASAPENYGTQFRDWEERSRQHFLGRTRFDDNNMGNYFLGQESHLKPGVQYVDHMVDIRRVRTSQSFSGEVVENFTFHIMSEVGKHKDVEDILNALATKVGLPTVQAFS